MRERKDGRMLDAYRAALPVCLPVMTSFMAIGISLGLFVTANDLPGWYAPLMSLAIFGGSLEFVTVTMLTGSFAPLEALAMAFMIQARHIFYGIAMLRRYDVKGRGRLYLIYSLCDESFSINGTVDPPAGVDRRRFMLAVSTLNQSFWVMGTTLGGTVGPMLPFDTSGLSFLMTAMFTVILVEQLLKEKRHHSAVIGFAASVACLYLFGSGSFLIPTLVLIVVLLLLFRRPIEEGLG